MDEAFDKLFQERPHLKPRSRKLYRHNVDNMLRDQFSLDADITDISGNPDLVINYLDSCCENTAKLTCTSVIALLKCNGCENDTLMPFVRKHQELAGKLKEKSDMQSTDKDFATLEEIRGVETLLRRVVKQKKLFCRDAADDEERDLLQRLLLVRLYLKYPLRNEYSTLKITNCPTDAKYSGNWICTRPYKIILNDYKTSNKYGHKEYELPPDISRLAARVVRSSQSGYLLNCKKCAASPITGPYFNHYLSNIFMETINKRIGSSAIRKAHVTDMYKDAPSIAQKQALADIMNHKPETAEQFYCKKHFTGIQESTNSA